MKAGKNPSFILPLDGDVKQIASYQRSLVFFNLCVVGFAPRHIPALGGYPLADAAVEYTLNKSITLT